MKTDPNALDVLLVEDDPADVELAVEALKASQFSFKITAVENGARALDYLRNAPPWTKAPKPDLILLDLNMPKMGGRETLKLIKDDPALAALPVVILTTSRTQEDIADCYALGASGYVPKPLHLDGAGEMVRGVEAVLLREGPFKNRLAAKPDLLRVLLVEDDPGDAEIVREHLESDQRGFELVHCERLADALAALDREHLDVVLVDLNLPDSTGLKSFEAIRAKAPDLPVIVLSGLSDEDAGIAAVHGGAQDFLVKGRYAPENLVRSIRYSVERHKLRMELSLVSLTDELTGLNNRRGFVALAGQELRTGLRIGKGAFLAYVDMDGMKQINDTLGHGAGDRAIVDLAAVLKDTFRESDVLGRLGGDEFAVFGLNEPGEDGLGFVKRLRENVARFNQESDRPYALAISVGIVHCLPGEFRGLDVLMTEADRRMYSEKRAKKCGEDCPPTSLTF